MAHTGQPSSECVEPVKPAAMQQCENKCDPGPTENPEGICSMGNCTLARSASGKQMNSCGMAKHGLVGQVVPIILSKLLGQVCSLAQAV